MFQTKMFINRQKHLLIINSTAIEIKNVPLELGSIGIVHDNLITYGLLNTLADIKILSNKFLFILNYFFTKVNKRWAIEDSRKIQKSS